MKGREDMAAEITAWFSSIDDAENAARELRKRGRGIRSLRIRQPKRKSWDDEGQMRTALALYGTPLGQSYISGGGYAAAAGFIPMVFEDSAANQGGMDGPAGRKDCLMVVITDDSAAQTDAALLTALHASHVHTVPRLPS